MDTVTATELHDRTSELTEQTMRNPERPIIVEKHGKPAIVLMDARYYEGLLETLDLLSDPRAMAEIRRGIADVKAGRLVDHAEVKKEFGLGSSTRRSSVERNRPRRAPANRKSNRRAKDHRKS